jgi:cytochrome c553
MVKKKIIQTTLLIILPLIAIISCNHADQLVQNNSEYGDDESHNMGENCMNCHKQGGEGDGWFYIAGTAYTNNGANPAKDVKVIMFTEPNGQGIVKKIIEGDKLGNFYTTDITGFGSGLFPAVVYNNDTTYMSSSTTNGSCNSCHGNSTSKIEVN